MSPDLDAVTAGQRRGRRIALEPAGLHALLTEERTCRVGSVDAAGRPHVTPLWFVWDGGALWLSSVVASRRWSNLTRSPQVSVVVDTGHEFDELRGAELTGTVQVVGGVPQLDDEDATAVPTRLFGQKYAAGTFRPDGRHAWLRLTPDRIVSWDFRRLRPDRQVGQTVSGA